MNLESWTTGELQSLNQRNAHGEYGYLTVKGNSHENVSVILEIITVVLKPISTLPRKKEIMQVSKNAPP